MLILYARNRQIKSINVHYNSKINIILLLTTTFTLLTFIKYFWKFYGKYNPKADNDSNVSPLWKKMKVDIHPFIKNKILNKKSPIIDINMITTAIAICEHVECKLNTQNQSLQLEPSFSISSIKSYFTNLNEKMKVKIIPTAKKKNTKNAKGNKVIGTQDNAIQQILLLYYIDYNTNILL